MDEQVMNTEAAPLAAVAPVAASILVKYVTNGQSYPITIAAGTTFEQFISSLSARVPEIVVNQNIRTLTRAGVYTAQLVDYSAGNVHPSMALQQGDIIAASGKIDGGR